MAFEQFMIDKIEAWVYTKDKERVGMQNQTNDDGSLKIPPLYKVADLQLAFDNDKMLSMLEARGTALKAMKFEKAEEIQQKMTNYKNENFESITTPKAFYCTFHSEYAYTTALFLNELEVMGESFPATQAAEPTDIIWENRPIRKMENRIRRVIVVCIMVIMSFAVFTIIVFLVKRKLIIKFMKEPPGVNC